MIKALISFYLSFFFQLRINKVKTIESPAFNEIQAYERDLYSFTYQSEDPYNLKEYNVDIFMAIKKYQIPEWNEEKNKVKFVRRDNRVSICRIK